jgi:hypothetical protein
VLTIAIRLLAARILSPSSVISLKRFRLILGIRMPWLIKNGYFANTLGINLVSAAQMHFLPLTKEVFSLAAAARQRTERGVQVIESRVDEIEREALHAQIFPHDRARGGTGGGRRNRAARASSPMGAHGRGCGGPSPARSPPRAGATSTSGRTRRLREPSYRPQTPATIRGPTRGHFRLSFGHRDSGARLHRASRISGVPRHGGP